MKIWNTNFDEDCVLAHIFVFSTQLHALYILLHCTVPFLFLYMPIYIRNCRNIVQVFCIHGQLTVETGFYQRARYTGTHFSFRENTALGHKYFIKLLRLLNFGKVFQRGAFLFVLPLHAFVWICINCNNIPILICGLSNPGMVWDNEKISKILIPS